MLSTMPPLSGIMANVRYIEQYNRKPWAANGHLFATQINLVVVRAWTQSMSAVGTPVTTTCPSGGLLLDNTQKC